jgi:hypothetical protein
VLVLLIAAAAAVIARNYSDLLGTPMSYLYNDMGYLTNDSPFTVLDTVHSNGDVFVSNTNGSGSWIPTNTFSTVGVTTSLTVLTALPATFSTLVISNGLVKAVQ